jgi:hypothetical protein
MTVHQPFPHTVHGRVLELAAGAIDIELTQAESAELDAHLAACPICARRATGMRADARILAQPLSLLPSAGVDAAIAAEIAGRRSRPGRLMLVAVTALLALALLGAAAIGAYLLRIQRTPPITMVPQPTAPLVDTNPRPDTSVVRWERWAPVTGAPAYDGGEASLLIDVVGFSGGYVAIGTTRTAWFSPDGQAWSTVELPFPASTGAFDQVLDARVTAIASNGDEVVIVGGYSRESCRRPTGDTGGGPWCPSSPISWVSTDGRTWRSSHPWQGPKDPPGHDQGSEFLAVWPVPTGGWDASIGFWHGESLTGRDLWHSEDGIDWTILAPTTLPADLQGYAFPVIGFADPNGDRVAWQTWAQYDGMTGALAGWVTPVSASPDGRAWRELDGFPSAGARVFGGMAPASSGSSRWILVGSTTGGAGTASSPIIWTSDDGTTWSPTAMPVDSAPTESCTSLELVVPCTLVASVDAVIHTDDGYLAVGSFLHESGLGMTQTWSSPDGKSWVDHGSSAFGHALIADGPAGIIVIAVADGQDGRLDAWRLDRSTNPSTGLPPRSSASEAPGPTPFVAPSPECPAPAYAVEPPNVAASAGGRLAVFATRGSHTVVTCSTSGSSDASPTSPTERLEARRGETISLSLPADWRFVHWEGSDAAAVGEGANVWQPTDLPDPTRSFELPVPNRTGDSIVTLDVVVVSLDRHVVMRISIQVLVHVV